MRIGIDISKAVEPRDGVALYARGLVATLMDADRENEYFLYHLLAPVELTVFATAFPGAPPNFVPRPGRRPADDGLDVFHATAHAVPAVGGARLAFTVYDLTFLSHPSAHTLHNRLHCLQGLVRAAAGGARFLAISEATAESLRGEIGAAPGGLEVIHPGVRPDFVPLPPEAARDRVQRGYGLDGPYVLALGVLEPRKNLVRLIEAWAGLPAALRRAHPLVLAGPDGWAAEQIRAAAESAGGGVRLLGFVAEADLAALYGAAAAFAYPSLAEGFGLPLLEALACGTPSLTSSASSLPEVAGDAALYVDPLEAGAIRAALERLLTDRALCRELAEKGRRQAARFTWVDSARRHVEAYRRCLES